MRSKGLWLPAFRTLEQFRTLVAKRDKKKKKKRCAPPQPSSGSSMSSRYVLLVAFLSSSFFFLLLLGLFPPSFFFTLTFLFLFIFIFIFLLLLMLLFCCAVALVPPGMAVPQPRQGAHQALPGVHAAQHAHGRARLPLRGVHRGQPKVQQVSRRPHGAAAAAGQAAPRVLGGGVVLCLRGPAPGRVPLRAGGSPRTKKKKEKKRRRRRKKERKQGRRKQARRSKKKE